MVAKAIDPLLVIVGTTASGKSALAIDVAERLGGEIIAADSRTIYQGLDIGTAKPTQADRQRIKHHLLDITTPDHPITVADYQKLALAAIENITRNDRLPILVGGTGLYIDAVLFNYTFRPLASRELHLELQTLSVEALQARILQEGITMPENNQNPRHLIRSLETQGAEGIKHILRPNSVIIGLRIEEQGELRKRITQRVETMIAKGLMDEAVRLIRKYGNVEPLRTIGYQEWLPYMAKLCTIDDVKASIVQHSLAYAKRQTTWFKRNKSIHWLNSRSNSVEIITALLNK